MSKNQKSALFFPINGQGLGHLNRCLAYARHLPKSWRISFFSLSPVIEPILKMGFAAEYFLSPFWTKNSSYFWNHEMAIRLGMLMEHVRPDILVFDGGYPFLGLQWALSKRGKPLTVIWSRRGLSKTTDENINERLFDLILRPGEIDASPGPCPSGKPPVIDIPPVTLFGRQELLPPDEARKFLGLPADEKYILISLASGNYKQINEQGLFLLEEVQKAGYRPVWLQSPLSIKPLELPTGIARLSAYPIAHCMKAFSGMISAAGYNTCCEAALAGLKTLFLPNDNLIDDQRSRALILAERNLGVVCEKEDASSLKEKIREFFNFIESPAAPPLHFANGAETGGGVIRKFSMKYKFNP